MKRVLSKESRDKRVVLIDNLKHQLNWGELEGLLTSSVISGRKLYEGEGRRPNTVTWFLTVNGARLSRDLAQRCVVIHVRRPEHYTPDWQAETARYVEENRAAIVGDCLALLRQPPRTLTGYTRWSSWEAAVLSHCERADECLNLIEARRGGIDAERDKVEEVREAFRRELNRMGVADPSRARAHFTTEHVRALLSVAADERLSKQAASYRLAQLCVPELQRGKHAQQRGWFWLGNEAPPDGKVVTAPARGDGGT
jgi:hypothetical protein